MTSVTTRRFREMLAALPPDVRRHAYSAYRQFRRNPAHPGLRFKKVDETLNVWSARIGLAHRALGRLDGKEIIWFWIGAHGDYDRQI